MEQSKAQNSVRTVHRADTIKLMLGNKGVEQTNLPIRIHHQKEQFHPLTAQIT